MRRGFQLLPGILASLLCVAPADGKTYGAQAVEFCLDGEFDLGVRLQGLRPVAGEFYGARFCIVTEDDSQRVRFSAEGHANPDMRDDFAVAYLSERFIDFLAEELPGRPLRAVALTHAHDDHAGGARAFAAAGADVYAPAAANAFLARALNREEMPPDRLSAGNGRVTPEPVSERVLLDDPSNRVELLPVGPGPHVQDSLGLWARDRGIFFQSDLLVPRSDADEPRAGRATTECWFARWAVANLPMETLVLSSHSDIRTPVSRLAAYLESETCRTADPPSQAGPRP